MYIFLFFSMTALSVLHIYWALGGVWPARSKEDFYRTLIGAPNGENKPPSAALTFLVALLIFIAGLFALPIINEMLPRLRALSLVFTTIIFLGRGFATYIFTGYFKSTLEPFQTLNRRYFSPLCIILGVGYLILTLSLFGID